MSRGVIPKFVRSVLQQQYNVHLASGSPNPSPRWLEADVVWCPPVSQGFDSTVNSLDTSHLSGYVEHRERGGRCVLHRAESTMGPVVEIKRPEVDEVAAA